MLSLIQRYLLVACLVVYAMVLGLLHAAGRFPCPGLYDVSRLIGSPSMTLEGQILDFPVTRWNQTRFLFDARAAPLSAFHGRVAVTLAFPRSELGPGDQLRLRGWISSPREATASRPFDEKRYWAGQQTFVLLKVWSEDQCERTHPAPAGAWHSWAWSFQKRFRDYWEQRLPSDEAELVLGITVGGRSRLSPVLKDACIRAGVYHIMVVSGQNVSLLIVCGIAGLRLLRVQRRHALWICTVPLVFYATVVGGDPPVVRAVIMGLVSLTAATFRRDVPRLYPLAWAAFLILLADPAALFGASFQLSFGATASLLAFSPWLEKVNHLGPKPFRWGIETGAVCVAVYIGIWPLLVYYFHRLSLVGFVANWTIFPLSGLLLALGLGIGVFGVAFPAVVPRAALRLIAWLAHATLWSIYRLARPGLASLTCSPPGPGWFGMYYGLLFCILLIFHRRSIRRTYASKNSPLSTHRTHL